MVPAGKETRCDCGAMLQGVGERLRVTGEGPDPATGVLVTVEGPTHADCVWGLREGESEAMNPLFGSHGWGW